MAGSSLRVGLIGSGYMGNLPLMWKCWRETAGGGALADVGSNIICVVQFVVGPIAEVAGQLHTVNTTRPVARGSSERGPVETDDQARLLSRFESGATGMIEASRVALGRRMLLSYEVTGRRQFVLQPGADARAAAVLSRGLTRASRLHHVVPEHTGTLHPARGAPPPEGEGRCCCAPTAAA